MKKTIFKIILVVCSVIFVFSAVQLVKIWHDYQQGTDEYESVRDIYKETTTQAETTTVSETETETETTEVQDDHTGGLVSFAANAREHEIDSSVMVVGVPVNYLLVPDYVLNFDLLKELNSEVKAWISIEGTYIDYPVVQGTDNAFYLRHTISRESNNAGSVFIECTTQDPFNELNTIIYAHNQYNHQMFHDLTYYSEYDFWESHRYFTIETPECRYVYEVFAAYDTKVATSNTYKRFSGLSSSYTDYLNWCYSQTTYTMDVQIQPTDRIVTLSTCDNVTEDGRFVVQGRLISEQKK